jgi:TonB family protein
MMTPLLVVLLVSAQLLLIISVATLAVSLSRATDPRLRLAYWRSVALACLALPLMASFSPAPVTFGLPVLVGAGGGGESAASLQPVLRAADRVVWWLLAAGALVRLSWLCAGAVWMRQLRQRSRAAALTPDLDAIKAVVAPQADLRVSSEIAQPAGFGLSRPVVLLPERFFSMDPEAQRTVVCHELLHVARCDWPWLVAEEVVRALFWFHPAVWWLVERIQESREQLVDRLVIERVPSKRAYMVALLAFADGDEVVAPATAFLRRRHLRSRLQKLAKESVMSRRRLVWTAVVLTCVMGGAVAGTVVALPLDWSIGETAAHAQEVADSKDPDVSLPEVVSSVKAQYTAAALQAQIEGTVMMTVVVRTDGIPTDIEVTKSLDSDYGLDTQAVTALSQWRFEPGRKNGEPVPVRVTVETRFTLK